MRLPHVWNRLYYRVWSVKIKFYPNATKSTMYLIEEHTGISPLVLPNIRWNIPISSNLDYKIKEPISVRTIFDIWKWCDIAETRL